MPNLNSLQLVQILTEEKKISNGGVSHGIGARLRKKKIDVLLRSSFLTHKLGVGLKF